MVATLVGLAAFALGGFAGIYVALLSARRDFGAECSARRTLMRALKAECCRNCKVRVANYLAAAATGRSAPTAQ